MYIALTFFCKDLILHIYSGIFLKPFPTYRRYLTTMQQMTFENIMTKVEIAQNKQFSPFAKMFSTTFSYYTYIYRVYTVHLPKFFQSCLLKIRCRWERVKGIIQK